MSEKCRRGRVLVWVPVLLLLVVVVWGFESVHAGITGKVIDKANCQEYKDLLIPMQLKAIEKDGWILKLATLDFDYKLDDKFIAGSKKNAGKFAVHDGWIVEKNTTNRVPFIFGHPFPEINPKDPDAGEKVMWNFKYLFYRKGTSTGIGSNVSINERGLEYDTGGGEIQFFTQGRYDGPVAKNPDNVLAGALGWKTYPMASRGGAGLTFEYNDERPNASWVYSPLSRRIMRWGAGDRSAPLPAGDLWQDSQELWRGKNVTFNWKLIGERTILAGFAKTTKSKATLNSDGSISFLPSPVKYGYEVQGWGGAPWVAIDVLYVPRKVWIIEGMPKDPYYNYGRHHFYVDQQTYEIWLQEVEDRAGNPWLWQYRNHEYFEASNGMNNIGTTQGNGIIDVKARHSTISGDATEAITIFTPAVSFGLERFNTTEMLKRLK